MSNRPGFRGLCPTPLSPPLLFLSLPSICSAKAKLLLPPPPIRLHCSAALGWCSRDVNENGQSPPPLLPHLVAQEREPVSWLGLVG